MYSEKRIRQILHEFKMKREFFKKISEDELRKNYWNEHVHLEEKIILLETILEESAWQKLMNQHKKENVFVRRFGIMVDYFFRSLK